MIIAPRWRRSIRPETRLSGRCRILTPARAEVGDPSVIEIFSTNATVRLFEGQVDQSDTLELLGRPENELESIIMVTNSEVSHPMEDSRVASIGTVAATPEAPSDNSSRLVTEGRTSEKAVQGVLAGWWQELLTAEHVNLDDDFFELGGHSLVGVQLFSRIKDTYGIDLGLSTLFDARTVRQLAELICQHSKSGDVESNPWCTLVPIQPKGSRPPLIWIPGGNGTSVLLFKEVSLLLGPDQPAYGLEAKMPEPDEEFVSIPERSRRFIKEVRTLQPQGPYFLIGFCGGGFVAFEMAQQLAAQGQEVAFLCIVECADDRHPDSLFGKIRFRVDRAVLRGQKLLARGPKGMALWTAEHLKSAIQTTHLRVKRVEARLAGKPVPPLPCGSRGHV
jgi:acyl carrier protein